MSEDPMGKRAAPIGAETTLRERTAVDRDLAYRCFIFDFDGTLVRSNRIKREGFFETTKGLNGARRELQAILSGPNPGDRTQVFEQLVERLGEGDPASLAATYGRYCQDKIALCPEVPGAKALLELLKGAGRAIFVNSGTPEDALMAVVSGRGFEPYLDGVYGLPGKKVENVLRALETSAATGETCVVIGDGESDRSAALEVGCAFIGVRSDGNDFAVPPACLLDDLIPMVRCLTVEAKIRMRGAF